MCLSICGMQSVQQAATVETPPSVVRTAANVVPSVVEVEHPLTHRTAHSLLQQDGQSPFVDHRFH